MRCNEAYKGLTKSGGSGFGAVPIFTKLGWVGVSGVSKTELKKDLQGRHHGLYPALDGRFTRVRQEAIRRVDG